MTLPSYILRQIAGGYQRSGSLPKMVPLVPEPPKYPIVNYHSGKTSSDEFGGLEYQWWMATPTKLAATTNYKFSDFVCRACGTKVWTKYGRDEHFQKGTCRAVTTHLLKVLKGAGKCLQCMKPTSNSRYGALLCSKPCEELWLNSGTRSEYWIKEILGQRQEPKVVTVFSNGVRLLEVPAGQEVSGKIGGTK